MKSLKKSLDDPEKGQPQPPEPPESSSGRRKLTGMDDLALLRLENAVEKAEALGIALVEREGQSWVVRFTPLPG